MAVYVQTNDEALIEFQTGANWHIDPEGFLHVRDAADAHGEPGKHIAAFHRSSWTFVTNRPAQ